MQAEETNKAIKESGLSPYSLASGPGGMTTTYRQAEPLSKDNIHRALAGMGGEELVGPAFNIPKPMPLPQSMAQSQFPVASMTGQAGDISQSGESMDYGKVVQQALQQKFAPGMDEATISRDYLGLPQPEAEESLPNEFWDEISSIKTMSGEDGKKFVKGLYNLSFRYINDPVAMKKIDELIKLNRSANVDKKTITYEDYL